MADSPHLSSTVNDPLLQIVVRQIDMVCDRFETELKAGKHVQFSEFWDQQAEFVNSISPASQEYLFSQLLALAREYAEKQGTALSSAELIERYPEFAQITATQFRPHIRYFGDYEILSEVGSGSFGVVYKAIQTSLKRIVAIKLLAPRTFTQDQIARFRWEAEAVAGLNHPRIVPIYEVGTYENQHFFAMGYIDGISLKELIKKGRPSLFKVAEIMRDCAVALQYSHDRNIVHRDIAPGNILIATDGQPVIVDFGLAMHTQLGVGHARADELTGTPHYMAPEQASGGGTDVGSRADIYGLGSVFYQLITGVPPFSGSNAMDVIAQVKDPDKSPVPPDQLVSKVPPDVSAICMRCLAKNPSNRYQSMRELADDLNRWLTLRPVHARRSSLLRRILLFCRRRPTIVFFLATSAFVALFAAFSEWRNVELEGQLKGVLLTAITPPDSLTDALIEVHDDNENIYTTGAAVPAPTDISTIQRLAKLELLQDDSQEFLENDLIQSLLSKYNKELSQSDDVDLRFRAAQSIGIGPKENKGWVDVAVSALNDPDTRVQLAALSSARRIRNLPEEAFRVVVDLVKDVPNRSDGLMSPRQTFAFELLAMNANTSHVAREYTRTHLMSCSLRDKGGAQLSTPVISTLSFLRGLLLCSDFTSEEYNAFYRLAGHEDERIGVLAAEATLAAPSLLIQHFRSNILRDLDETSADSLLAAHYRAGRLGQHFDSEFKQKIAIRTETHLTAISPDVRRISHYAWLALVIPNSEQSEIVARGILDQMDNVSTEVLTTIGIRAHTPSMDWLIYPVVSSAVYRQTHSNILKVRLAAKFAASHQSPEHLERFWIELNTALNRPNPVDRRIACFFIGELQVPDDRVSARLLEKLKSDPDVNVRVMSAMQLAKLDAPMISDILTQLIQAERTKANVTRVFWFREARRVLAARQSLTK